MLSTSYSPMRHIFSDQDEENFSRKTLYSPRSPKVFFSSENSSSYKYSNSYNSSSTNIDLEIGQFAEREIFNGFGSKRKNYENFGINIDEEEEEDVKRYQIANFDQILQKINPSKTTCKSKNNSNSSINSSSKATSKESVEINILISKDNQENQNQQSEINHNKIFEIKKVPKNDSNSSSNENAAPLPFTFDSINLNLNSENNKDDNDINKKKLNRKRRRMSQEKWELVFVPKEKHFMLDRKKHRIVFQRKHLKVIYSVVHLQFPINFQKCFEKIKQHVGDKTKENFGNRKSFHFIEVNGNEEIMLLNEKKDILRKEKNKCCKKKNGK